MGKSPDFAGWVTKNDIRCADGVIIRHGAFEVNDGTTVPLVWQHDYNTPSNVIGSILLHSAQEGVYGEAFLNATQRGKDAKELVRHGDITAMSIGAKGIRKEGDDVVHGEIYEVSLVLRGANPGAVIEHVMQHSAYGDYEDQERGVIYTGLEDSIILHSDNEGVNNSMTIGDVLGSLTPDQLAVAEVLIEDGVDGLSQEGLEILETFSDDQVLALESVLESIEDDIDSLDEDEDYQEEEDEDEPSEEQYEISQSYNLFGGDTLKHNAFVDNNDNDHLTHSDLNTIVNTAVLNHASSLSKTLLANGVTQGVSLQHGLANIDILFPNTTAQRGVQVYNPNALNVEKMMGAFGKSPMSRVKNIYADITEEEARARGYIKGNEKMDSIEKIFFRETTPHTVIRRTKIDRDDIIDIQENGIDVVAFMQETQRVKFMEEVVRAAILGDGRSTRLSDGTRNPDKIDEEHVRPIMTDDDLYTIKVTAASWATVVDDVLLQRAAYGGSGRPSLIINPFDLAKLKIIKDKNGRYLYAPSTDNNQVPSDANIAAYFGCSEVIEYRAMPQGRFLIGNLGDYIFGASRGGQVATFNQFDIDFNQEKYLMEARLSGAIQAPKAFIAVTVTDAASVSEVSLDFNTTGVKQHPTWLNDSAKLENQKPGAKYASAESDKATVEAADEAAKQKALKPGG